MDPTTKAQWKLEQQETTMWVQMFTFLKYGNLVF